MNILVVEDDVLISQLLFDVLEAQKYTVNLAHTGTDALEMLQKEGFNLVILDYNLPDTTGLEILQTIRKTHSQADMPIVFLSGTTDSKNITAALAAGANDFVAKPFTAVNLCLKISNLLALQKAHLELKQANMEIKEARDQYEAQAEEYKQIADILHDTNQKLSEREEIMQFVFNAANLATAVHDSNGKFVLFNNMWCDMHGYSADELRNLSFNDITHPDDRRMINEQVNRLRNGSVDKFQIEKRSFRKDKSVIWVSLTVSAIRSDDNIITNFIGTVEDITAKKNQKC